MKAILVNPKDRTIKEVEYEGGLDALYELLNCSIIDAVRLGTDTTIWVDDEGLLLPEFTIFSIMNTQLQLAGNALFTGVDEEGDTTSCPLTLEEVKEMVIWGQTYTSI